jgi:DNA-binding MltR family transcriptional regulator
MKNNKSIWPEIILASDKAMANKIRSEILVRDTFLDEILRRRLERYFTHSDETVERLFDPMKSGPISTLTQKANFSYALGIIDKVTLKDIKNLHKIRNRFAHLAEPDFTDKKIADAIKALSVTKKCDVTSDNYLEIYKKAALKCIKHMLDVLNQEEKELKKCKAKGTDRKE